VNSQLRTADSGGDAATPAIHKARPLPCRNWHGTLSLALLAALAALFSGCGVQAPPRPPRLEIPQTIKDLAARQIGSTVHITFTMPVLATDGEKLNKPVTITVFRTVAPPGQQPALPDASASPWLTLDPKQLAGFTHSGKVDYPLEFTASEIRQRQGSAFSFAVVALTHGFRGHPRRSEPSNNIHVTLLDATGPVTNLVAKASQNSLLLTWDKPAETLTGLPPSHISGYRVYQSLTGKLDSYTLAGKADSNHFDDKTFRFGQRYFFRVSAVTTVGKATAESVLSAPVSVTPLDVFPPPVPTGLTAVNAASAVDLLWNASSGSDLAGYNIYRSSEGGPFLRINKKLVLTPIFHDATVEPGHSYKYAVTAVDLTGNESSKSETASAAVPSSNSQ
jgi:Fibronectin type III domain